MKEPSEIRSSLFILQTSFIHIIVYTSSVIKNIIYSQRNLMTFNKTRSFTFSIIIIIAFLLTANLHSQLRLHQQKPPLGKLLL